MNVLEAALARGQQALSERDAKQFLAGFGIPICREIAAADVETIAAEASRLGFPVALKAAGPTLLHKTEVGGVALNLRSPDEVRREGRRLLETPGCEYLLVQEMVQGARELVCGLMRDAHLGPCVMFGLGGIFTETLEDAVFRVAPLRPPDALEMITEIRSAKILGAFRGEAQADLDAVSRILLALGEIGMRFDTIRAIDINPVKIRTDGAPVAVDALISLIAPTGGSA